MAILSFLSVFALYLASLYPGLAPGAAGWVPAAATLGVLHEGGPLPVLLGKAAAAAIPWGQIAYRVNALSALLGAGSVLLTAAALARLAPARPRFLSTAQEVERERWEKTSRWMAVLIGAATAASWRASIAAGPAAVHLFLSAFLFWSASRWMEMETLVSRTIFARRWLLAVFLFGLALGMDGIAALWIPGFLGLLLARRQPQAILRPASVARQRPNEKALLLDWGAPLAGTLAGVGLGLSLALFSYYRSLAGPSADLDGELLGMLPFSFLRDFFVGDGLQSGSGGAAAYAASLLWAFTPAGLLLILWGGYRTARQELSFFNVFLLFWAVPALCFVLFCGPGRAGASGLPLFLSSLTGLTALLARGFYEAGRRPWARAALACLLPLTLALHLSASRRGDLRARDLGVNLLKSLPSGAVLWSPGGDASGAVLYQQDVIGNRLDVALADAESARGRQEFRRLHPEASAAPGPAAVEGTEGLAGFLKDLLNGPRGKLLFAEDPRAWDRNDLAAAGLRAAYPDDVLPVGLACRYFPARAYRLIDPAAQLSLARLSFWWFRRSATEPVPPSPGAFSFRSEFPGRAADADIARRYARAHARMGDKFAQYGIPGRAEEEYERSLAADPLLPEACESLGSLAYAQGNGRRAAILFRRALAARPGDFDLLTRLGLAHALAGQDRQALDAFRAAARLRPRDRETRFRLAESLEKNHLYDEALIIWKDLRDKNPEDKAPHWHLARTYEALGRPEKALQSLREYFLFSLTREEISRAEALRTALLAKLPPA